jgi:hypothetical protein
VVYLHYYQKGNNEKYLFLVLKHGNLRKRNMGMEMDFGRQSTRT